MTTTPSPKSPFPIEVRCDGDTIAARFSLGWLTFTATWHHTTADNGTSRWRTTNVASERRPVDVGPRPSDDVVANTLDAMTAALKGLAPTADLKAHVTDAFAAVDLPVFTRPPSTNTAGR